MRLLSALISGAVLAVLRARGHPQDTRNALERVNVAAALDLRGRAGARGARLETNLTEATYRAGDWVEISWRGLDFPKDDDFVAVVAERHGERSAAAATPVSYKLASSSPGYLDTGRGSTTCAAPSRRPRLRNIRWPAWGAGAAGMPSTRPRPRCFGRCGAECDVAGQKRAVLSSAAP